MHLVGFTIEIYHDARPHVRHTCTKHQHVSSEIPQFYSIFFIFFFVDKGMNSIKTVAYVSLEENHAYS